METNHDKLSIKNLLFTKVIPNYVIPLPINGHKVYACTDCGDKFILESSYEYHINRNSIKISYSCKHCSQTKIFYNRCNLLSHIRSHAFKTATINVTDLKIEPLPISFFKTNVNYTPKESTSAQQTTVVSNAKKHNKMVKSTCYECKKDITITGTIYKDRAQHYMQYTNEVYSCPVCLFGLPTSCGLKAHLRVHLVCPPYYCPECGIHLQNKSIFYPYSHDCEGFKMMRVTARLKCPIPECHLIHPNAYKEHLKVSHLKKVYKCPFCFVACFNEPIMEKHLKSHKSKGKALIFFQCEMCPGRLVLQNQIENHLKGHVNNNMYPCWGCGSVFKDVTTLIEHHISTHGSQNDIIKDLYDSIVKESGQKPRRVYRVVKRCDQCNRSFTYNCKFEQIQMLPNDCPYKCSANTGAEAQILQDTTTEAQITCHMCKNKISQNWENIKQHYAEHHKSHRCLDAKIVLPRLNMSEFKTNIGRKVKDNATSIKKRKRRGRKRRQQKDVIAENIAKSTVTSASTKTGELVCNKCGLDCQDQQLFEAHLLTHRDPCMSYQCMECGQCFVVKPSFSTHLLLEHGISDVQDYISKKQCYNETALMKYQQGSVVNEPLRENQCKICRDQFNSSSDLEKHFRVHGMAFLLQNNSNKNGSP